MAKDKLDLLIDRYGLRYRTATEVIALDEHMQTWILALLGIAYEKGKNDVYKNYDYGSYK